jgi:parvulin-like peptidyl-prolyl isomerase
LEMKLDTDPAVAKEIARARDRILIKARLAKFAEVDLSPSEVTQLAKEYWLLHQDEFKEESKRSVSHILIGNKARTDDDAEKLAQELYKKLKTDPLNFEQFVAEYSDDPGSKSEKGSLGLSERGRFVPEFSQVAFSLKKVGDISEPVKTRFGYHLIRLDEIVEEKKFSFEESEKDAATKALSEYVKAKQQQYLNDLRASANRTVHEESIKALWEEMFPR